MIETYIRKQYKNTKKTEIDIFEEEARDLIIKNTSVKGIITNKREILSKKTILTTGTFLNGKMYTGDEVQKGGRIGEGTAIPLSKKLYSLNLPMGRLKTGTPARIKYSSINTSVMEEQPGERPTPWMSLYNQPKNIKNNYHVLLLEQTKKHIKL